MVLLTAQGVLSSGIAFSRQASTEFIVISGMASLGAVQAQLIDENGNGLNETMRLSFPITIATPGNYTVGAEVFGSNGKSFPVGMSGRS